MPDFNSAFNFDIEPTDAQSLVESLRPGELTPTELCNKADQLLEKVGERTQVDGIDSLVTRKYWRIDQEHGSFYARIGRQIKKVGPALPAFILTTTPDFDDIETPNGKFSELFFDYNDHGTQLLNGPDAPTIDGYRSNRPGHLGLANQIIQNIKLAYKQDPNAAPRVPAENAAMVKGWVDDALEHPHSGSRRKRSRLGLGLLAGALIIVAPTVGVVVVESGGSSTDQTQVDAPPPHLQNPICNTAGVCVEGPSTPLQTIPLAPLADIHQLPVDIAYEKPMSSISIKSVETLNPNHIIQTEQGIYQYTYPVETTALPDDGDCTFIEGNFNQGISKAFTTSSKLAGLLRLKVLDTSTLEVCMVPGAPATVIGSFYIARSTP